ncbi:MAG: zinc-binding dehydrogenase [Bacilli bacterium]
MKCVEIDGVKSLKVIEKENPEINFGNVIFKVDTCGICGSDIHYWDMGNPFGLVMGHEFCGTVINPGDRSDLKVGDKITGLPISPCGECDACKSGNPQYCTQTWTHAVGLSLDNSGAYAQVSSCHPNMVRLLPEGVKEEEGCMVEPSAVSLHAIKLADITVGEKVCIIGGGIIGLMAAEFAKMEGATYVALLETNEARGNKALKFGYVDEYYNALDEKTIPTLKDRTYGGFDKVIECCGNSGAVSEAMSLAKNGGTIVLVGVSMAPITIPMVIPVMGEIVMKGSIGYTEFDFDNVIELIKEKKIDVLKYIDDIIPLEKVQDAFERLTSGKDDAIKIIIKPNN